MIISKRKLAAFFAGRFVDWVWIAAGGYMVAKSDWAGLVICGLGFLGTTLITSALRSRGRRP